MKIDKEQYSLKMFHLEIILYILNKLELNEQGNPTYKVLHNFVIKYM